MFFLVAFFLFLIVIFLVSSLFEFSSDKNPDKLNKERCFSGKKSMLVAFYSNIKYWLFVFRWFLIGKYHCNAPKKARPFYWAINKTLWAFIMFCVWFFFIKLHE